MTIDQEDVKHWVQQAPAVLFGVGRELDQRLFLRVIDFLLERAGGSDTDAVRDDHWRAVEHRLTGASRWDSLVPRSTAGLRTAEGIREMIDSQHSVENILKRRPYTAATVNGIQYVLDVFDPSGELGIPYKDAGAPVLALLLHGTTREAVNDHLSTNEAFYEIVAGIDAIVDAHHVTGNFSMVNTMMAFNSGQLSPLLSVWDIFHQLVTVPAAGAPPRDVLQRLFARVETFSRDRLLLQLTSGFDFIVRRETQLGAELLGLTFRKVE